MKKILLLSLVLISSIVATAQLHEWAKPIEAYIRTAGLNSQASAQSNDVDSLDNSYVAGEYSDSISFDSFSLAGFRTNTNYSQEGFVSKLNSKGEVQWLKRIDARYARIPQIKIKDVKVVNNNRIIVFGSAALNSGGAMSVYFSPNDSLFITSPNTYGLLFLVEYDSLGNVTYYQKVLESSMYQASLNSNRGNLEIDKDGNIILGFYIRLGGVGFYNTVFYTKNGSTSGYTPDPRGYSFVLKYSPDYENIIYLTDITAQINRPQQAGTVPNTIIQRIRSDKDGYIYGIISMSIVSGSVTIGNKQYNNFNLGSQAGKNIIFVLDPNGNVKYIDLFHENTGQIDKVNDILPIDTNNIYIVGYIPDTIVRYGQKYYSENYLPATSSPGGTYFPSFPFIMKMSLTKIDWVKFTKNHTWHATNYYHPYMSFDILKTDNKGGFYTTFTYYEYNNSITIGGLTSEMSGALKSAFLKFDAMGNVLWITPGFIVNDMVPNSQKELIYSGIIYPFKTLFNPVEINVNTVSGFVAKLMNYAIERGEVEPGPYCAGDTFYVPYNSEGKYDTANYFIAELSNPDGNFEGGEKELGRIKAMDDSTIIAIIPMYYVASSDKYRIRVRSTHPPVQSFYRLDTLEFKIYSRDKADPGPPEYACLGDSFMLNTYGGTAWEWSPTYNMGNPHSRTPYILADRDTVYRIIISDSSGCGAADTAYKQILVRPKAEVKASDSFYLCYDDYQQTIAYFGKDTDNVKWNKYYHWKWYIEDAQNNWNLIGADSLSKSDTISFVANNYFSLPTRMQVVLDDICALEKDTAYINVDFSPNRPKARLSLLDSIVCYNHNQRIAASFSGGDSMSYLWHWSEVDKSGHFTRIDSGQYEFTDMISVQIRSSTTDYQEYAIILWDECSRVEDTAFIKLYAPKITSHPQIIILDTLIACLNEEVNIIAHFKGGDITGYQWTWYNIPRPGDWRAAANDSFALVDTLLYKHTTTTRKMAIILEDGCSIVKDTAEFVITFNPKRTKGKITTPDSLQCYGSAVDLFGSIYGGDSTTYSWEWFEIDERNLPHFLSSGNNKFADTINVQLGKDVFDYKRFAFVTKDECLPYIDSSFIDLKIDRRVPQAVVLPSDTAICPSTSAKISAQIPSGSGKGFRWKWIDEKGNVISQDSGNVSETSIFIKPNFINETDSQRFWFIVEDICSPESDTQTFVIAPLPPIKLIPNTFDTTICHKQLLNLSAIGSGGTASNFLWKWRVIDPASSVMLNLFQHLSPSNGMLNQVQYDTLSGYLPPPNLHNLLVTLSLTDGCMEKGDSVSINIKILDPLQAEILDFTKNPAQDTFVCSGSDLKFFASGIGGVSSDYKFTWFLDDDEISTDNFVEINSKDFKNLNAVLTLILSDDCSVMADTQQINIQTLPKLKAEFTAPDTLCLGEEISLLAEGTGGISNQYQFTWLHKKDDGSFEVLESRNTLNLNSKKLVSANDFNKFNKREILLVLTDNCSSPNDTFSKKIIIRPELSLSLSSSTICANPDALLTANPKGGNPNSHQIFWYDESNNFLGNGLTKTVNPLGFDKFTAILKDACSSDSAIAEIQIDHIPDLLILNSNPTEGCQPLPITFEPQTDYPDKYNFVLNLGNNDSANISEGTANYEYVYTSFGTFTPTLKIKTQSGCEKQIVGSPITVHPKPTAAYTYDPENPDMDNPFVNFINQSTGATDYIWTLDPYGDFFESDPIIEYKDTGYHNIRLISISEHDCRDTIESIIYIKTNYRVFLPSAFSPNGDGLNDDFKPSVRGFSELDFRVYNRWGELIFRSTKDEAWDGTYNGIPMPEGVYAFTLNVISANGEKQFFRGTVTMMR